MLLDTIRTLAAASPFHFATRMDVAQHHPGIALKEIEMEADELMYAGFIIIGRTVNDYYYKPIEEVEGIEVDENDIPNNQ